MAAINNLSFNVRFNLTGAPTLVLTDTTASPPAGLLGIFAITQPDGYTRTGNINTPDISTAGSSFSILLRLDSTGNVQCGQYEIVYTGVAVGYDDTDFTRIFQFSYNPVVLNISDNFDVFTPNLSVTDITNYSVSNYSNTAVVRAWNVTSTPTGAITGSGATLSFQFGGQYYEANYTISITSSLTYTHQVYAWLTVQEVLSKTYNACIDSPPDPETIVDWIHNLKVQWDDAVNTCKKQDDLQKDFEFSQTLYTHIVYRVLINNTDKIYEDLKDLVAVLNNYQIPQCSPSNIPIQPYNISIFAPGAAWGNIEGTISNQTDLWNILQNLYLRDNYVHDQQVASTSWVVVHGMGKKPSVMVVDTSDEEVIGDVAYNSINQITITFSAPVSGKAYIN